MFFSYNDRGPHVVLLQALLRLEGYNLTISGYWQQKTEDAIAHFRMKMGVHSKHGPANGPVFARLVGGKHIKVIDAIDASAGGVYTYGAKAIREAGEIPVVNERRVGHGVEDAISRIRKRAMGQRIGALRFTGHGNKGTWISVALGDPVHGEIAGKPANYSDMEADWPSYIDYAHLGKMMPILQKLAPSFAPFGFVEAHCCQIGKQTQLLEGLADIWGVPVSGGLDNQRVNDAYYDQWGNKILTTFSLRGPVKTAYPRNMTLEQWAARADLSVPNFPGMLEKGKNAVKGQLKRL
ncbi:MAG: hypothetical protein ABI831_24500 [Betaproteobacteria bacterium]